MYPALLLERAGVESAKASPEEKLADCLKLGLIAARAGDVCESVGGDGR